MWNKRRIWRKGGAVFLDVYQVLGLMINFGILVATIILGIWALVNDGRKK